MADKDQNNPTLTRKSQDTADRITESLALRVTGKDVDQYPELVKLLSSLSQHLTPDGMGKATEQDINESCDRLKQAKSKWLQQHTLYHELQELLLDQDIAATNKQSSSQQFYRAVQECLSLAEVGDYLHCSPDPESNVTLLGLKKEDIQRRNPHTRHLSSIQQQLIPEIEGRLRKKCENLVHFHDSSDASQDSKFVFAKASQLPAVLERELQYLEGQQKLLEKDKQSRERQFWQYYKAVTDSLEVLEKLITRHRLTAQKEKSTVTNEWLTAHCDAMYLKIKFLELQLLCDTYQADTVVALNTIKKNLNSAIQNHNEELYRLTQALKGYEGAGMGFDSLVREYTYLQEQIENKTWAMKELKESLD